MKNLRFTLQIVHGCQGYVLERREEGSYIIEELFISTNIRFAKDYLTEVAKNINVTMYKLSHYSEDRSRINYTYEVIPETFEQLLSVVLE